MKTIYLAGGCFWGMQRFFDQFDGVISTETGYANGRSVPFPWGVCYGALAIHLQPYLQCGEADGVEAFLDRVTSIMDEEISAADILERAKAEAGIDINELLGA